MNRSGIWHVFTLCPGPVLIFAVYSAVSLRRLFPEMFS